LHGTSQSGQLHRMSRSVADRGNSGVPHSAKTASISAGISPASSFARNSAWLASRSSTARHCEVVSGSTPMLTLYGCGLDPCTRAMTLPWVSSNSSTCPLRA
jgi:hypothetical protein